MEPVYFASTDEMRAWFEANHETGSELQVGYHRKHTGKPTITWEQSVDQALCFGWIDGIRKSVDADRYTIRFTPRKPRSIWSNVNIKRVGELTERGLMKPAGIAAFEKRSAERSGIYSAEQENVALDAEFETRLKANEKAHAFFQKQPPSYKKAAIWWIISAKKDETKQKRLTQLIEDSENGRTVPPLTRPGPKK